MAAVFAATPVPAAAADLSETAAKETAIPTSGCVAVSESNMVTILKSLASDTRIYIH